jgi:23S rRNA (cytosine1962-C5)-methyltransferase
LLKSLVPRRDLFDPRHETAFRLFNGFTEGCPDLVIDLYGSTLLFYNHAEEPQKGDALVQEALGFLQNEPIFSGWLRAAWVKTRNAESQEGKRGRLIFGKKPDDRVKEHRVWYALDLQMSRDASFYLDTRLLRKWLIENAAGKTVLNAFAYTGSLGVAAMAGGAARVLHLDLKRSFLNLAKTSYTLNGFPIHKNDFFAADFFSAVAKLNRSGERFDILCLDPPFFSSTSKGRVDQVNESARLINKVRPLIKDGGCLVAVNNALYVSGAEYMRTLESLCAEGYLKIRELIPVPEDCTGYAATRMAAPITDPTPFNHSPKIAVLEVKRKT